MNTLVDKTTYKVPELTIEEATAFFAELYYGEHHIPGYAPKKYGYGWSINHDRGDMATSDFNALTRFVLMCHRDGYRGSVDAVRNQILRVAIWKREPGEGGISTHHPTIEQAIEKFNKPRT